jgi:opacity protein-like surface antigen
MEPSPGGSLLPDIGWPVHLGGSLMRRTVLVSTFLLAAVAATPQVAGADTLFGGSLGVFVPRGEGSRVSGDVLVENFGVRNGFRTLIDDIGETEPIKLFRGPSIGGEVLFGLGDFLEAGVGISYYQRDRDGFYTDFEDLDGTDIEQNTKLRVIPLSVTVRAFPIGRTVPVQPYVGGGLNFYRWKYTEVGEFIDFSDNTLPIFEDEFSDDGTAVGATILGGVRIPVGRTLNLGGEFRWQNGSADLAPELNFAGDKLDLGGFTLAGTVHVRF